MAYHDAPEVVPGSHVPQAAYGQGLEIAQPGKEVVEQSQKYYDGKQAFLWQNNAASTKRICGLSKRAFWIVVIVVVVLVVGGAVGGGVGGALAGKKSTSGTVVGASSTG